MTLEIILNSVVSSEIIYHYQIDSNRKFVDFKNTLFSKTIELESNKRYNQTVISHAQSEINEFENDMNKYEDLC